MTDIEKELAVAITIKNSAETQADYEAACKVIAECLKKLGR